MKLIIIFLLFSTMVKAEMNKITFQTKDSIYLNAKLFVPEKSADKNVGIVIIEGSGKSGVDKELESSPFLQLGRELSTNGYHVLTYNKRGSGENAKNGSFWKATFTSDNSDAQAAINFLDASILSKNKKIFLIGHSFGGPHALVLAPQNKISGIVMLTSTVSPVKNLQMEQTKTILELTGQKEDAIAKELKHLSDQIEKIKNNTFKCEKPRCRLHDGVEVVDDSIQVPWWKEVLNLDLEKKLLDVNIPVHFIFGTSDAIIPDSDKQLVESIIKDKKTKNITVTTIDKLDHFLVENNSKKDSLYYAKNAQQSHVFKTISNKLVIDIINFLSQNSH
jgi:pimeloyl-ACP methyl ester carboxylesterase